MSVSLTARPGWLDNDSSGMTQYRARNIDERDAEKIGKGSEREINTVSPPHAKSTIGWFAVFYHCRVLCIVWGLIAISSAVYAEPAADFLVRDTDFVRGDPKAPVTLLEYSDFTCGYCEKFFHETFPRLLSEYIDTGKVRFVYRDFPRAPGGPGMHASQAARCAGEQDAYWPMHDRLFNSGQQFALDQLRGYAKDLELDAAKFAQCLDGDNFVKEIYQDRIEGGTLGIRGTPGFVIFVTSLPQDGKMVMIPGAFPFDVFQEELEKVLKSVPSHVGPKSSSDSSSPQAQGM